MTVTHDLDRHLANFKPLPSDIDLISRYSKQDAIEALTDAISLKGRVSGPNRTALRPILVSIMTVAVAVIAFAFERATLMTMALGFSVLVVAACLVFMFGDDSRRTDERAANIDAWVKVLELRVEGKIRSSKWIPKTHPSPTFACGCLSAELID